MNKIILDLCGGTGSWSRPKTDAEFRAMTPPGFAWAFYEENKYE